MATHDEAGAAAALALLDARELSQDDARQFATNPSAPWRAVGARALVRSEDRPLRLKALLDPDPRVRRQAVRAARDDQDPDDLGALSEAARVDPEPIVRTEAVRAMVELEPLPPGELADLLRDLWPRADEGLREDIAIAWASPRVWDQGGSEALLQPRGQRPRPRGHRGRGGRPASRHHGRRGRGRGHRADGARRLVGLARAPPAGHRRRPPRAARAARRREEGLGGRRSEVRVAAFARLAEAKQPGAMDALVSLAGPGSPVAQRARFALASLGDRRVQAWVEQDLQCRGVEARLGAATTLSAMGVAARAAPLLADPDAAVRVKVACTILLGARRD